MTRLRADKARRVVLVLTAPVWVPVGGVLLAACLVVGVFALSVMIVSTPFGVYQWLVKTSDYATDLHPAAKMLYKLFPEDEAAAALGRWPGGAS